MLTTHSKFEAQQKSLKQISLAEILIKRSGNSTTFNSYFIIIIHWDRIVIVQYVISDLFVSDLFLRTQSAAIFVADILTAEKGTNLCSIRKHCVDCARCAHIDYSFCKNFMQRWTTMAILTNHLVHEWQLCDKHSLPKHILVFLRRQLPLYNIYF